MDKRFFRSLSCLTLVIISIYLFKTDPFTRSYDGLSHIVYTTKIMNYGPLIRSTDCWQCYHPPLYYAIAGIFLRIVYPAIEISSGKCLQIFSLLLYGLFLWAGFKLILKSMGETPEALLATSIFFLWPVGFIHSVRVGNDSLFYLLHMAALLESTKAFLSPEKAQIHFRSAAVAAAGCILAKANGFMTMVVVGSAMAWYYWKTRNETRKKFAWVPAAGILAVGAILFLVIVHLKGNVRTNAAGLPDTLRVGQSIRNMFGVNVGQYLVPYASTARDETGRQYFWIFLLKSSLFGEFSSNDGIARFLAVVCNVLLLVVLGFAIRGWFRCLRVKKHPVLILNAGWLLLASFVYRWILPYAPSGDFRYIFPIVISIAVFASEEIYFQMKSKLNPVGILGIACVSIFLLCGSVSTLLMASETKVLRFSQQKKIKAENLVRGAEKALN